MYRATPKCRIGRIGDHLAIGRKLNRGIQKIAAHAVDICLKPGAVFEKQYRFAYIQGYFVDVIQIQASLTNDLDSFFPSHMLQISEDQFSCTAGNITDVFPIQLVKPL
jgi:hypothetical protein